MSKFNDLYRAQIRLNRLHGLRDQLLDCSQAIEQGCLDTVLTHADRERIDSLFRDYMGKIWHLKDAYDLCSPILREFLSEGWKTVRDLELVHFEWNKLKAGTYLNSKVADKQFAALRVAHRAILLRVKRLIQQRRHLVEEDWVFVFDYLKLPPETAESRVKWIKTTHDLVRRYPWKVGVRSKTDLIGYPDFAQAKRLATLWQVESHLNLPLSFRDRTMWVPDEFKES